MKPKCETCMAWYQYPAFPNQGECRMNAPSGVGFGKTEIDAWCMDWEPVEDDAPDPVFDEDLRKAWVNSGLTPDVIAAGCDAYRATIISSVRETVEAIY